MSKESYRSSSTASGGSYVVKRSPADSGRRMNSKALAGSILAQSGLRESMFHNINSLDRVLKESEKILPRTHNTMNR